MTIRNTRTVVTFANSFALEGVGGLPAGTYDVETTEELLPTSPFNFYRRLATTIRLRGPAPMRTYAIGATELDALLMQDSGKAILSAMKQVDAPGRVPGAG